MIQSIGAGTHKSRYHKLYNNLAKKASKAGVEVLKNGGDALDAVKAAVVGMYLTYDFIISSLFV